MLSSISTVKAADTGLMIPLVQQLNAAPGTRNDAASGKVGGTDARADRFVGALSSDTETTQKISRVPEVSFGEQSFDMYDEVALPPRPILEMAREAYEKLSDLVEEMKPQASATPEVPAETAQQSAEAADVEASEGRQRATDSEPETVRVAESETPIAAAPAEVNVQTDAETVDLTSA